MRDFSPTFFPHENLNLLARDTLLLAAASECTVCSLPTCEHSILAPIFGPMFCSRLVSSVLEKNKPQHEGADKGRRLIRIWQRAKLIKGPPQTENRFCSPFASSSQTCSAASPHFHSPILAAIFVAQTGPWLRLGFPQLRASLRAGNAPKRQQDEPANERAQNMLKYGDRSVIAIDLRRAGQLLVGLDSVIECVRRSIHFWRAGSALCAPPTRTPPTGLSLPLCLQT